MEPSVYPYYERLSHNPDDAEALYFLWDYHGGRAEFQQLATLVEQTAGRRADPHSAADLFFRAGELWAKNVGRADKAVGNYRRAYELDPGQLGAVEAARAIYLQLGNIRSAAQLLERQLAQTADPLVRAMLLREGAQIHGQLGDASSQIAYLDELLGQSPDDWELLRELASAYLGRAQSPQAQADDAPNAARLLSTLAQSVGGEHGVAFAESALDAFAGDEPAYAVLHEAYGAQGRLEDLAVRQIAFVAANPTSPYTPVIRRALADQYIAYGQADDAIACLEPLLGDDPSLARTLAGLYRDAGRAHELAALLQSLAAETEPAQRMVDLKELAALYGQQGNRTAMLETLREVLAIDPADLEALALVEDDLRARGAWNELRDALAEAVRAEHCPPDQRLPRLREIAQVSLQYLDDPQAAIDAYTEVVESSPGDADALAGLDLVLSRMQRWESLAEVLQQRAEAEADPQARGDVLLRLADLHRDHTELPQAEADALGRAFALWPGDQALGMRLLARYQANGEPSLALEVLQTLAERAPPEEGPHRWAEVARAREGLGDLPGAIQCWRTVIDRDPSFEGAWDNLDRVLAGGGQHRVRFATLQERAEALPDGPARAAIHAKASDAARAMGDPHAALAEAERAVQMAPEDEGLTDAVMDSLEALGEHARLLEFVSAKVAETPDGPRRVSLLRRAAAAVGASNPAEAMGVWAQVRECSVRAGLGDDAEAIDALLGLAELAGDTERVVALLAEAAMATADLDTRRGLLTRRAMMLHGELGRGDEGLAALVSVARELSSEHAPTWAMLERVALAQGARGLVFEAMERQVRLESDEDAQVELAARLVSFVEAEPGEEGALRAALELQHEVDPGDLVLVQRLADLAEAEGRWADAVGYLDELAEVEGDDEELSKLALTVAAIADTHLDDPQRAWEVLLPLSQAGDIACLEALKELSARRGMHREIVPVLVELAGQVAEPESRAMLWDEVASRRESYLDDPDGALSAQVEAVVSCPGVVEGLDRIDRVAAAARRPDRVATAYRAALNAASDPTTVHELATRGLASLEAAGGGDEALEFALSALSQLPADDELLDAVVRFARGTDRSNDVYVALDRRKKAAQGEAERFAVVLRAAQTAAVAFGDRDTAFQYLEQALAQGIGRREPDPNLLQQLEDCARKTDGDRPEIGMVAGVVERYAAIAEDASEDNPQQSASLLRRAAELCERELALTDQAYGLLSRAVNVWPADTRSADALEPLGARMRRLGDVASLYQKVADNAYEAAVARAYTRRRADILGDRLHRVDEALDAYRRLAEIAPKDLDMLAAWQTLLSRNERWQDLLFALERELDAGADKAGVYRRMAAVWETRLGNQFEARDCWKKVLRHSPDDVEARQALDRLDRRGRSVDDDLLDDAAPPVELAPPAAEVPQEELDELEEMEVDEAHDAHDAVEGYEGALVEEEVELSEAEAPVALDDDPALYEALAAEAEAEAPAADPRAGWFDPVPEPSDDASDEPEGYAAPVADARSAPALGDIDALMHAVETGPRPSMPVVEPDEALGDLSEAAAAWDAAQPEEESPEAALDALFAQDLQSGSWAVEADDAVEADEELSLEADLIDDDDDAAEGLDAHAEMEGYAQEPEEDAVGEMVSAGDGPPARPSQPPPLPMGSRRSE